MEKNSICSICSVIHFFLIGHLHIITQEESILPWCSIVPLEKWKQTNLLLRVIMKMEGADCLHSIPYWSYQTNTETHVTLFSSDTHNLPTLSTSASNQFLWSTFPFQSPRSHLLPLPGCALANSRKQRSRSDPLSCHSESQVFLNNAKHLLFTSCSISTCLGRVHIDVQRRLCSDVPARYVLLNQVLLVTLPSRSHVHLHHCISTRVVVDRWN